MKLDRRDFLRRTTLASAGLASGGGWFEGDGSAAAPGRVVHVHHGRAARWPRASGRYRDFVDLAAVRRMLDAAVAELKGTGADEAWSRVFAKPDPAARKLSIKINCNNAYDPADGAGDDIDAIPEPVIAVIDGFVRAGGRAANVNVYDATNSPPQRHIATWFRDRVRAAHPGTLFNAPWSGGTGCDARTCVTWSGGYATTPPATRLAGAVLAADYVVNVPIVKRHGQANVTLGYKNHFGSVAACDRLHPYVFYDTPNVSALADIMGSPVVPGDPSVEPLYRKTVLTVGDMLYGQPCSNFDQPPVPWVTWGGEWPNGLVVSDDPCAADSVMLDLLEAEPALSGCGSLRSWARRYLQVASQKGQGTYDHVALPSGQRFDAARMAYTRLAYRYLDLWPSGAALDVTRDATGAPVLAWEHYFATGRFEVLRATRPDFADAIVVGLTTQRTYRDGTAPPRAFYRIRYSA